MGWNTNLIYDWLTNLILLSCLMRLHQELGSSSAVAEQKPLLSPHAATFLPSCPFPTSTPFRWVRMGALMWWGNSGKFLVYTTEVKPGCVHSSSKFSSGHEWNLCNFGICWKDKVEGRKFWKHPSEAGKTSSKIFQDFLLFYLLFCFQHSKKNVL